MPDRPATVCLLGFGEVGQTLADGLSRQAGLRLIAFDLLFAEPESKPSIAVGGRDTVERAESAEAAAGPADLVISAVTAAEARRAAASVHQSLRPGAWYLDLNSVSPGTRRAVAGLVESAGARYVEAAVMSPILPHGTASPMLLGGPRAADAAEALRPLGFTAARVYAAEIGKASAAKMCRSVVVKGLEALLTEALLAARREGVERTVLDTLGNIIGGPDWEQLARYMLSRSLAHAERRADEMREAAATVREAGIEDWMSRACEKRQRRAMAYGVDSLDADLGDLLDSLLGAHYGGQAGDARLD